MSTTRQPKHATRSRVIALFYDELGCAFLGDRTNRSNSNIEENYLTARLARRGAL